MDTSDRSVVNRVLGQDNILAAEIPPNAWLHLIDQVYQSGRFGAERCLFRRFADWHYAGMPRAPRGATVFDRGLGVNTVIRLSHVATIHSGECLSKRNERWSKTEEQFLLLLKRGEWNMPLQWAVWIVNYTTAVKADEQGGYVHTVNSSVVSRVSAKDVVEIFQNHWIAAYNLLAVWPEVDAHARALLEETYNLTRSAEWIRGTMARIKP